MIDQMRQSTDFVVVTLDEKGQIVRYLPMALELNYQSKRLDQDFNFSVLIDNVEKQEKGIKVYLWNRKTGIKHQLNALNIDVFKEGKRKLSY
jgi:hypothetical protein